MDKRLTDDSPLQFGIRDLLIAQAICAVCFGLFAMVGIFALLAIFSGTIILYSTRVGPKNAKLKRAVIDLLGGILLPALCLFYDPFIFLHCNAGSPGQTALIAIVCQMLALFGFMVVGRWLGRWNALFSGFLWVGVIVSGIVGVIIAIPSLIGILVYGIGLLGFTPILTCAVFADNASRAFARAKSAADRKPSLLFVLGFVLAIAIPICLTLSFGPWIQTTLNSMPQPKDNTFPFD